MQKSSQKKIPQTDEIFHQVHLLNTQADQDPHSLRISLDTKTGVQIGEFDRGGKTRIPTAALDHDFKPETTLIPVGIFLPQYNEVFFGFVTTKVTADCLVDLLEYWWKQVKHRFEEIHRWVLNVDNGPENHSRRTQFMSRLVQWVHQEQIELQLAYYPPYHSKYNPVERTFGWLEQHWSGSLLDSVETVIKFAQNLTYKGRQPVVHLVTDTYQTGVRLSPKEMKELEKQWLRLPGLEKWFVTIPPPERT